MSKSKTYFSLFQDGNCLETGKNSQTKKEAILAGIDYVKVDSSAPSRLSRMSLKNKESYLQASCGIYVHDHDEKMVDDEPTDRRGTQRSPFSPWS